jgi:nucleolar protein 58
MLLLFETSAGYALFKVLKPDKITSPTLWESFQTAEKASSVVKLKSFAPYGSTTEAVVAATSIIEGTLDKGLKKFLKKHIKDDSGEELAVADVKLGSVIKDKLEIQCVHNDGVMELIRGVRNQMDNLLGSDAETGGLKSMQLGLSHSLSRYKLKFSADKVDIMIVQAIGLLDDLDKEINIYAMRVREWYGWHFPEMAKILNDNMFYARCVLRMGMRINCKNCDFSDILADEAVETTLKKTAETSMGTEISEMDLMNIKSLCEQVLALSEYRIQLFDYLKNRMSAIAPNLTMMVGELVGARLIAHSGSLINLSKHPASTIQILGAEKALFRALKTKTDTPKYGLIYHASLIGQAAPKNKGKISRVLAAKTALAIRVDALGDNDGPTIAYDNKLKVEARIRQLEGGQKAALSVSGSAATGPAKYDSAAARALAPPKYNTASDVQLDAASAKKDKKEKKRDRDDGEGEVSAKKAKRSEEDGDKESKKKSKRDSAEAADSDEGEKKKKKKKDKSERE